MPASAAVDPLSPPLIPAPSRPPGVAPTVAPPPAAALSWSHSRDGTFRRCAREYRYQYYTSAGGWRADAPLAARRAYVLKQLVPSLFAALGGELHARAREIARAVRDGGAVPPLEALRARTRAGLNALYANRDRGRFADDPRRRPMLHERFYGYGPSREKVEQVREKLETCTYHLRACALWEELREARAARGDTGLAVFLIDRTHTFELDGVTVYAAPDLALRVGDRWTIAEFKSGPAPEAPAQLALYASFAVHALGAPADAVVDGRVYRLDTGGALAVDVGPDERASARRRVAESVGAMRAMCADPAANVALPEEAFALSSRPHRCPWCRFFACCARAQGFGGEPPEADDGDPGATSGPGGVSGDATA